MSFYDGLQIALVFATLFILIPIVGTFMYKALSGAWTGHSWVGAPERAVYKILGVKPAEEMRLGSYIGAVIGVSLISFAFVFLLQLYQASLPLNPLNLPDLSWHLAFNTAVSFMTNTNWQSYGGESTMSYLVQMLGLGVQNFVSAAVGIAGLLVLIRAFTREKTQFIGNFWVDMTRSVLYILLPLSFVMALVLVQQGVIQNFDSAQTVQTLEGQTQVIPQGPAASQIAIKQLGTNGGGFFNTNSTHPYENPTPFSNFISLLALLLIPAGLVYSFGLFIGDRRQAWTLIAAMTILLVLGLGLSLYSEYSMNPTQMQAGLMEGKETRFGIVNSILWSTFTTAASNGSVNAMHSSLSPLSGMVSMLNIMLGEVIFGGVGSGLCGMLLFVILSVFIAGLMVGRSPEYLGKKIEAREIQWTIVGVLAPSAFILLGTALAVSIPEGLSSLANKGPHGFSEILYAFTSASGNNGSAFAGLNANTVFYNVALGLAMLVGRFAVLLPVLAIASGLAMKKRIPVSAGSFKTDGPLFAGLLVGVVLIVGGLTFFPSLALGPLVEQFLMLQGQGF